MKALVRRSGIFPSWSSFGRGAAPRDLTEHEETEGENKKLQLYKQGGSLPGRRGAAVLCGTGIGCDRC